NFNGTEAVYSSATYLVSFSTLTIGNLTPATTYYFRAGTLNWNTVYNFVTVGSTPTLPVPAPILSGTALGVSSISWTWSTIAGAQTYNLYYATGTLVAGGLTGTGTAEVGLSTNVAY